MQSKRPLFKNWKSYRKFGRIGFNFSTRMMGNVVSKLLGLITVPIIARALGPESYGQYNLVMITLAYTAFFVDFGFSAYGVRESAREENSLSIVSQILSARLTLALASILVSMVVVFILFSRNLHLLMIIYIGFIWVLAQGMNIDYYYFGKKNMLIPTSSQISGQILYVVLVIFFIKQPTHLALLVLFYSLYCLWASSLGIVLYLRKNQRVDIVISFKKALAILKKTFRLGICARIESFQGSFALLIIAAFLGNYALGIFSAAFKLFTIILLIFQTMILALAPYLVKLRHLNPDRQRKYIHLLAGVMFLISIVISIFCYTGGEMMMNLLFGESFGASAPIFKLICLILVPSTPLAMVMSSLLVYFDFDKKYLAGITASGLVILLFTPLLVHFMSLKGAIWAMSLANATNMAFSLYNINKVIPNIWGFSYKKKEISIQWGQG